MKNHSELKNFFQLHKKTILELFTKFLLFKTISAEPSCQSDLEACATWLKEHLSSLGGTVDLWKGDGAPIVFAHFPSPNKEAPTVLIYNHYDVQPVDPVEEWVNPPFDAYIDEDTVFARGAQDNKGQCLFVLLALELLKEDLPCSIKLVIEGEEENGSSLLSKIALEKKEELRADYTMIIDLGMRKSDTPAITLGTRGITSLTVTVDGPNQDLHSGVHGGIAQNPLQAIASMLSSLHNKDGSVAVPGFYDAVIMPDKSETTLLALDMDEKDWAHEFGQAPVGGEKIYAPIIRNWLRPTLEINGIHGGYGGEGSKTVIPRTALAKISCRLVPNQDPERIADCIKTYLLQQTPDGIKATITIHDGMGSATRTRVSSPAVKALATAMEEVWNKKAEFVLEGASIPISPLLEKASGGELIMWGVGIASDRIHSPNERFSLSRMEKGCLTLYHTLTLLGKK